MNMEKAMHSQQKVHKEKNNNTNYTPSIIGLSTATVNPYNIKDYNWFIYSYC